MPILIILQKYRSNKDDLADLKRSLEKLKTILEGHAKDSPETKIAKRLVGFNA